MRGSLRGGLDVVTAAIAFLSGLSPVFTLPVADRNDDSPNSIEVRLRLLNDGYRHALWKQEVYVERELKKRYPELKIGYYLDDQNEKQYASLIRKLEKRKRRDRKYDRIRKEVNDYDEAISWQDARMKTMSLSFERRFGAFSETHERFAKETALMDDVRRFRAGSRDERMAIKKAGGIEAARAFMITLGRNRRVLDEMMKLREEKNERLYPHRRNRDQSSDGLDAILGSTQMTDAQMNSILGEDIASLNARRKKARKKKKQAEKGSKFSMYERNFMHIPWHMVGLKIMEKYGDDIKSL